MSKLVDGQRKWRKHKNLACRVCLMLTFLLYTTTNLDLPTSFENDYIALRPVLFGAEDLAQSFYVSVFLVPPKDFGVIWNLEPFMKLIIFLFFNVRITFILTIMLA